MNSDQLKALLEQVRDRGVSVGDALGKLASWPTQDLGHTRLDTQRALRCGHPEVVFGAGKSPAQLVEIGREILAHHGELLVTRAAPEGAAALCQAIPAAKHFPACGAVRVDRNPAPTPVGHVLVVTAGTSDGPVAEEAVVTARAMGARVELLSDVGVAGIHRLLAHTDNLRQAHVVVVVAGMEGALPSVVGGLIDRPLIAVPTSVGYGASYAGLAALLAMLNSCAAGVLVTNIDNGFGAGYAAARINRMAEPKTP